MARDRDKDRQVHEILPPQYLWELGITEVAGHNLEATSREEVNQMLKDGWIILHIYTLKYKEDDIWRERPMAILGKPVKHKE